MTSKPTMTTYAPLKLVEVVEITYSDGSVEDWTLGTGDPFPISICMKRTVTHEPDPKANP